jgi:hypothetical protein
MVRIAISQAAFDAMARTMPFGSVNFEARVEDKGRALYLAASRGCRPALGRCAGPGASYNDIILRLAGGEPRHSQNPVA